MPRSGKVLIGPSADGHAAVDHLRLEEPLDLQVVHQVVGVVRRRVAVAHWPLPKKSSSPRSSLSLALRGIELAEDVELRRRREVEQLLELGHEVDLAAALEDVDALLACAITGSPSK